MAARAASLLALALLLLACARDGEGGVTVRIGALTIRAELARTPEERTVGLGGRPSLAEDAGMLFVFAEEGQPAFWMKGMRFPLDFIWIAGDGRIVDLTLDVPPPAPGTPDSQLERYQPRAPVRYVLEVNAGTVRRAGLEVGERVVFEPAPPTSAVATP